MRNKLDVKPLQNTLLLLAENYTQHDLDKVLKQNPKITRDGYELPSSKTYATNRDGLKNSLRPFQICCAVLSECYRTDMPNKMHSGQLKERIEYFMQAGYIPSGAVVAAAAHLGIKIVADKETPFVTLYMDSFPITRELEYAARFA